MILKVKNHKYDTAVLRQNFAEFLSCIVTGHNGHAFMPNHTDDFWRIDMVGNNWIIVFNEDNNLETFRISYRYHAGHPEYEQALYGWLKIKLSNLELVEA